MPIEIIERNEHVPTTQEQQTFFVAKSNELIQQSRFTMTVQQSKVMLYLISKIKPNDFGNETYSLSVREFSKVCNTILDSGKNYADAKKAIKTIADKSVWIKQDNGTEVLLRWLNRVKFDPATSCFEVSFHEDMLPYLYDLKTKYTRYCLDNVLLMKSKYGIRLYELLKSYQFMHKEIIISLDELKKRLDAENYNRYPDFRRYVLEKAIEDINTYSDLQVGYIPSYTKNKKSIDGIIFLVKKPAYFDEKMRKITKQRELTATGKAEAKRQEKVIQKNMEELKREE